MMSLRMQEREKETIFIMSKGTKLTNTKNLIGRWFTTCLYFTQHVLKKKKTGNSIYFVRTFLANIGIKERFPHDCNKKIIKKCINQSSIFMVNC